jgi:hypothetical protein
MGTAASSFSDLPERIDLPTLERILAKYKLTVQIDMIRFNLMKDPKDGTISRTQALQLIENKLPPIYSLNALVATRA